MIHRVYISLGSNLGDREGNLQTALNLLSPVARVLETSPVYETPPWGYADQPAFLNQAALLETELSPYELLACLKDIENKLGRVRTFPNGPRPIDLDISFYDDLVLQDEGLVIPHPRLEGRGFVLVPLASLAPDLVHPISGKSMRQLLEECDQTGITVYKPSHPR